MKVVFVSCFLLVVVNGFNLEFMEELKKIMLERINNCATQVSASPGDVDAIANRKTPSSHEGKCLLFCLHKKLNAQNEDGSLNLAGALNTVDFVKNTDADLHNIIATALNKCKETPVLSDPCDYAAALFERMVIETEALGLDETVAF